MIFTPEQYAELISTAPRVGPSPLKSPAEAAFCLFQLNGFKHPEDFFILFVSPLKGKSWLK